jgi:hypothetical protein
VSAANILKQDMANRHESYQQQINDIKGRLNPKSTKPAPTEDSGDPFAAFGGKKH